MSEYKLEPRHWLGNEQTAEHHRTEHKLLRRVGLTMLKGVEVIHKQIASSLPNSLLPSGMAPANAVPHRLNQDRMSRTFIPLIGNVTHSLVPGEDMAEPDSDIFEQ